MLNDKLVPQRNKVVWASARECGRQGTMTGAQEVRKQV